MVDNKQVKAIVEWRKNVARKEVTGAKATFFRILEPECDYVSQVYLDEICKKVNGIFEKEGFDWRVTNSMGDIVPIRKRW